MPVTGAGLIAGGLIMSENKQIGIILATAAFKDAMVGLASIRLSAIHDAEAGAVLQIDGLPDGLPIDLAIPDHLRPLPKAEAK